MRLWYIFLIIFSLSLAADQVPVQPTTNKKSLKNQKVRWGEEESFSPEYTSGFFKKFGLGVWGDGIAINHNSNPKWLQLNFVYGITKDLYGLNLGFANFTQGGKYKNEKERISNVKGLSLVLLTNYYEQSTNVTGISLAGGANILENGDFKGIALGIVNEVKGNVTGFALGILWNGIDKGKNFKGIAGGMVNRINGNLKGIVIGGVNGTDSTGTLTGISLGVANFAKEIKGIMIGGANSTIEEGDLSGLALGIMNGAIQGNLQGVIMGGYNFTGGEPFANTNRGGELKGLVVGLVSNKIEKDLKGIAIGGLGNVVYGDAYGMEAGLIGNYTGGVSFALQLGTLNYAKESKGIQIGILNYTPKKARLQLGLINIAWENPIPILPIVNFYIK